MVISTMRAGLRGSSTAGTGDGFVVWVVVFSEIEMRIRGASDEVALCGEVVPLYLRGVRAEGCREFVRRCI